MRIHGHGGPAYPILGHIDREATGGTDHIFHDHKGLTIRDVFAMHALPAVIPLVDGRGFIADVIQAYEIADMMLEVRQRRDPLKPNPPNVSDDEH